MNTRREYFAAVRERGRRWSPPNKLTRKMLESVRDKPRLSLSETINLMTFGSCETSQIASLEAIAKRQKAAASLFEAAKLETVLLFGDGRVGGDASNRIPASYFDQPRNLGHQDNCITTDLGEASMDAYVAAREGRHEEWFNVRVERSSFVKWILISFFDTRPSQRRAVERASRAVAELSQEDGWSGLNALDRLDKVNEWLKAAEERAISSRTLNRALSGK
jgi:hypothetical protein